MNFLTSVTTTSEMPFLSFLLLEQWTVQMKMYFPYVYAIFSLHRNKDCHSLSPHIKSIHPLWFLLISSEGEVAKQEMQDVSLPYDAFYYFLEDFEAFPVGSCSTAGTIPNGTCPDKPQRTKNHLCQILLTYSHTLDSDTFKKSIIIWKLFIEHLQPDIS